MDQEESKKGRAEVTGYAISCWCTCPYCGVGTPLSFSSGFASFPWYCSGCKKEYYVFASISLEVHKKEG